ncbi:regulator of G-protein signaling 22 [Lampris incognitus]|uniref:regulator of G-protein signaling 22 n=1 Tax=Lampris incognitus TaxID=2546036 RepID=UPI0024B631B6|nr:regulator of G-protein signaling 22 [Lampris incognitus]
MEFPHLTAVNFENHLASDIMLVHFFNDFLSLPCFPEALLYNQDTGVFQVASEAAERVSRQITSVLRRNKSQLLTEDPTLVSAGPPVDNHYTVHCLDREQGIQWIMTERFPFFIQSDFYFEYRLAKLMSQQNPNLCIHKSKGKRSVTRPFSPSQMNAENENVLKALTCSQEMISTKQGSAGERGAGLDEFKEFLRGTHGEKLFHLWMDIERLKATQHLERKSRHLMMMRSRFLLSGSRSSLGGELLYRLGLTTTPCWTEKKLRLLQPSITEALLLYCGSSTDPALSSNRMARMLQALYVDSQAGFYFTRFCELSGNQPWQNAVSFWSDLQHYHQLFYQDGLDPYKVQRQAQLLYSTYLCCSARRRIGVHEETRREVYNRLIPAFEELFDEAEAYTLSLLLEPWALLMARDKEIYRRVCVQEEVRWVDSEDYRELQSCYEEAKLRKKQMEQCKPNPPRFPPSALPEEPQEPTAWSNVPQCFRGYRLGSLLRHRHELQYFLSFLQHYDASIHLKCWLHLEEYRRIPQKDKAVRRKKTMDIITKYLNSKYFFGPDSPASIEQQHDMMRLAGGLKQMAQETLSNTAVMEIQSIVRSHIEKTWLPQFLATAEFTERQKHKLKLLAEVTLTEQVYRRRSKRREAWKAEGLWMSTSKEILVFRQVLLNPVTCQQFQHFVSLKGDFLENDLLFWLEVQRYKDLCHSHSDEATIQQKISTIINCFINSSMPPALQIDIPPEQAQHILEKRRDLGPYIFREAQLSVFCELLKLWPQFQALKSSVQEEQLLPLLREKRATYRARRQRRRRKEEERRALVRTQAELERQETSFTEEEDEEEEGGEGKSEKEDMLRGQSRMLHSPTQKLSWSYSKYMAALKREEILMKKQSQLNAATSFSTASDSSSGYSLRTAGSRNSQQQPSILSTMTKNRYSNKRGEVGDQV